jgi:hypothetical protein
MRCSEPTEISRRQLGGATYMQLDETIKATDIAIVIATLFGPILAVQAQVFLERRRERQGRRATIFHTLMRTRAALLSSDHVQALNAIPIEFYGVTKVTDAYRAYVQHTNTPQNNPQAWNDRRVDLLMDVLSKVAIKVGYGFDIVQLKSEFYAPQGHATVEAQQVAIREGLAKVLSGELELPLAIKSFPSDPETAALMKAWLKGERALKIETTADEPLA